MKKESTVILTKEQYNQWKEDHKNLNYYSFYERGNVIDKIWLKDRNEAEQHLKKLINNKKPKLFYYKQTNPFIIVNKNGTYRLEFDSICDAFMKNRDTLMDKIQSIYYRFIHKLETIKYFIRDIKYYIKNYDSYSRTSHNKVEWYNLIHHLIKDFKFNIPIMIKDGVSHPINFVSNEEWHKCLEDFLLLIQTYEFYSDDYSMKECNTFYKKLGKKFIDNHKKLLETIPYYSYSKDIIYIELLKLCDNSWNELWEWIKKHGRDLWD